MWPNLEISTKDGKVQDRHNWWLFHVLKAFTIFRL